MKDEIKQELANEREERRKDIERMLWRKSKESGD